MSYTTTSGPRSQTRRHDMITRLVTRTGLSTTGNHVIENGVVVFTANDGAVTRVSVDHVTIVTYSAETIVQL